MVKPARGPRRASRTAPRPRPLPEAPDPLAPRSCASCGSPLAWFGFGPPLTPKFIWACREHRAQVDEQITGMPEWLR
jgi:hypothetical protein